MLILWNLYIKVKGQNLDCNDQQSVPDKHVERFRPNNFILLFPLSIFMLKIRPKSF